MIERTNDYTIKSLGKQKTTVYDVEVNKNHNFFGNDILLHNSLHLRMDKLVDMLRGKIDVDNPHVVTKFLDKFVREKMQPMLEKSSEEMREYMNAYANKIHFKREKIADSAVYVAKKRYIMNVYDSEGIRYADPELYVTGIESVRSSTPMFVRDALEEAYKIILTGTQKELVAYIEGFEKEFNSKTFEDIAFPRTANNVNEYSDAATIYKKGTPIHVRGSLLFNHYIKQKGLDKTFPMIKDGDKIKFAYLKLPNPINENVIATSGGLPEELDLNQYLDYKTLFNKTFYDPIKSIADLIGWNITNEQTLDDFFN